MNVAIYECTPELRWFGFSDLIGLFAEFIGPFMHFIGLFPEFIGLSLCVLSTCLISCVRTLVTSVMSKDALLL
ncbi:hypothetical protein ABWW58_11430 [Sporolactobacillus sp. STCC-11]|uniref:hypothetical protein n=1 Tax=Sporolactobacillus caesalpiniae TaxID=3230362 RepID=UPI00339705AF